MWDQKVKEPVNNLSNFMYTMDCIIGPPATGESEQMSQCVFDTTTPVSSTFSTAFTNNPFSTTAWDSADSTTFFNYGVQKTYTSIGLDWTGDKAQDRFCLGDSDVHITVCMDDQDFVYIDDIETDTRWKR